MQETKRFGLSGADDGSVSASRFPQLKLKERFNALKLKLGLSKGINDVDDEEDDDDEVAASPKIGLGKVKKALPVIGAIGFVGVIAFVLISSGALSNINIQPPVLYVASAQGAINESGVNVRAMPNTSSQELGEFPLGHIETFDGRDSTGEWLRFHRIGYAQSYWVHSAFVDLPVPVRALPIDSATRLLGWSYIGFLMVILSFTLLTIDRWKEKGDIVMLGIACALAFLVKVVPGDSTSMMVLSGSAIALVVFAATSGKLDLTVAYYFAAIVAAVAGLLQTTGSFAFVGSAESVSRTFAVLALGLAIIEIARLKCKTTWMIVAGGSLLTALLSFWGFSPLIVLAVVLGMSIGLPTWLMSNQVNKKKPLCEGWQLLSDRKGTWVATDIGGLTLVVMLVFSIAI